jgi:translation initiation factor 2A
VKLCFSSFGVCSLTVFVSFSLITLLCVCTCRSFLVYLLKQLDRNTISWSPSGRFVCLAGFGNLAGGMDFWDINKRKKVPQYHPSGKDDELLVSYGNTAKPAGSFGWSPDSRLFHVSTMAPRMNVDNGVRIYKYNGDGPICDYPLVPDQLHFAEFVPPRLGEPLVDRPQSPPPFRNAKLVEVQRQEGTSTRLKDAATTSTTTPQAYIPPSARQRLSSGSLAERLRKEKETLTVGAGKIATIQKSAKPSSVVTGRSIPGMAPLNNGKGSSSNSAKKAKSKRPTSEAKKEAEEPKRTEAIEPKDEASKAVEPIFDADKRIKKINKLLKQIEELKVGDQSKLNDDQRKKIGNESVLLEELKALESSK